MTGEQIKRLEVFPRILDVRMADEYEEAHVTGARNNCVLEVGFEDRLAESAPDKKATTVVYGAGGGSHEAAVAFEKLLRMGYKDVHVLEGGLAAAGEAGLALTKGEPLLSGPIIEDGDFPVDLEKSAIRWTGRNLLNRHHGTVPLAGGILRIRGGKLETAEFVIDPAGLECGDLKGTPMHKVMVNHLTSDDFLDVARFPEVVFVVTKVEEISGATPGLANLRIRGGLTMRGETHPVDFEAISGITPEGEPVAQAVIAIDRTRWGIIYGSGRFFHRLAGHLVNDLVEIEVKIVGKV